MSKGTRQAAAEQNKSTNAGRAQAAHQVRHTNTKEGRSKPERVPNTIFDLLITLLNGDALLSIHALAHNHVARDEYIFLLLRDEDALVPVRLYYDLSAALHATTPCAASTTPGTTTPTSAAAAIAAATPSTEATAHSAAAGRAKTATATASSVTATSAAAKHC